MNTEQTEEKNVVDFTMPAFNEIPDVGLYLKQVVKYINETLGPWFDITVTETMLSNYVKMHMVPNAIKKQYYRDQIASMLFIVLAKNVVSLDNIQKLLKIREEKYQIKEAYLFVAENLEATMKAFFGDAETEKTSENNNSNEVQLLVRNIIIAIVQKYYIEKSFQKL